MLLPGEDRTRAQLRHRVAQLLVVAELQREHDTPELACLPVPVDPCTEGVIRCRIPRERLLEEGLAEQSKRREVLRRVAVRRGPPGDDADEPAVRDEQVLVPEVAVAQARLECAQA